LIRSARKLNARGEYGEKSFDQLIKVQTALRQDITDWSQSIGQPDIAKGVSDANKLFRTTVMPFRKNPVTRKVLQDENFDPDTLPSAMFKLDSPSRTQQSVNFLTPEGVQAGRYHLIREAEKRAMDDVTESGYSPSKFLRGTKLGETGPKLFSPNELNQINDLRDIVGLSRRAASFAADPQNGSRMAGITAMMNPKLSAMARGFSTLAHSPNVRNYALADSNISAGAGPLSRIAETGLRKAGIGLGLTLDSKEPIR
jgi:hypothetical protein